MVRATFGEFTGGTARARFLDTPPLRGRAGAHSPHGDTW
jgi:hypothetical protein